MQIIKELSAGLPFFVRQSTVDTQVLTSEYQYARFFADEYKATGFDTILDIGAHIGVFSVLAAKKNPRGRIYAIEAAKENHELLSMNVELNALRNVLCFNMALAERNGNLRLRLNEENWAHALESVEPRCHRKPTATYEMVIAETLEHFLERHGLDEVHYAKLNVEGAEYAIILNSSPSVLRRLRCMLIEFHPVDEHNGAHLTERLESCGFKTRIAFTNEDQRKGWVTAITKA